MTTTWLTTYPNPQGGAQVKEAHDTRAAAEAHRRALVDRHGKRESRNWCLVYAVDVDLTDALDGPQGTRSAPVAPGYTDKPPGRNGTIQ